MGASSSRHETALLFCSHRLDSKNMKDDPITPHHARASTSPQHTVISRLRNLFHPPNSDTSITELAMEHIEAPKLTVHVQGLLNLEDINPEYRDSTPTPERAATMLQFDAHSPAIYRRPPSNSHQQASSPPPTSTISSFSPSRIFSSISSSIHSQSTDLSNVSPTFSIASPLLSSSSLSTSSQEIIAPTTPSVSYHTHDSAHIRDTRSVWKSFQNSSQDSLLNDQDQQAYHSMEIKEGKKPERLAPPIQTQAEDHLSAACDNTDDEDEWYGLEYTLELSSRDDQPADTAIPWSPGEHSRSRESWAALREGLFHPYFEAQDYQEWKNWHRYLDRLDERRRHRKGLAFQHRARDLAWLYAEEFRLRDMIEMQLEAFGTSSRDLSERLVTVMARRPDPFRPPQHHGYSWYLKRSRSVGCLRDLTGTSTGTMIKAE